MCGIAGVATADGLRSSDAALVNDMLVAIAHRGPDDQFTLGDERALIGSRRLSIIDVEGGRQPLTDESNKIICSQNGEIYNYVELRADLERRGHVFGPMATQRRSRICTRSSDPPSSPTFGACLPSQFGMVASTVWCWPATDSGRSHSIGG